ncbi:MAG: hypothetical protein KA004_05165 [Verrucomicrobiales bacterium]|nr:hypothetical protein [Verrucomicrobiales bacterium]
MTYYFFCVTSIPDSVIISLLTALIASGGASLKYLWTRVNRLQAQVARLSAQLSIFRQCPVTNCPVQDMAASVTAIDRTLGGAA